jgi:hypothetical protein
MLDDFNALDLLSMGGFKLSPPPKDDVDLDKVGKKRFGKLHLGKHGVPGRQGKRRFSEFLPLIGRKLHLPVARKRSLQGWPVTLSWPAKEAAVFDPWRDQDHLPLC